jgi:G3E family GTPase
MIAPRLILLSGFLGSGKTTLLRRILACSNPGATAAVINEAADIGIDQNLVENTQDEVEVVVGGCICCSVQDDLERVAARLLDRRARGEIDPFDTLIIETTGLADPVAALTDIRSGDAALGAIASTCIVTVLDAVHGAGQLEEFVESRRQVASADLIILSKSLYARPEACKKLVDEVRQINGHARIIDADCTDADLMDVMKDAPSRVGRPVMVEGLSVGHTPSVSILCLRSNTRLQLDRLAFWLHELCWTIGPRLLRVKGIIQVEGITVPLVVHCVAGVAYPVVRLETPLGAEHPSELVVIGRGFDTAKVKQGFMDLSAVTGKQKRTTVIVPN